MARVLSLFDGMACGMLAMMDAGIEVERYVSYEVDKYATKTSKHNFPMMEQHGDVFEADFTQYEGFDYLIGGSPCTHWSIAQTKNRETTASGIGWELFSQYVRALEEAKPKYFLYENNKSMSKEIRRSITDTFGFEPICINSALVSAQNRNRLYWVGIRCDDGKYKSANVYQPKDEGILLKDILETSGMDLTSNDKSWALTTSYPNCVAWNTIERNQRNMVVEKVKPETWLDKSHTIDANYYKGGNLTGFKRQSGQRLMAAEPINVTSDNKSRTIIAQYGAKQGLLNSIGATGFGCTGVAEPVCMRYERTEEGKKLRKAYENHEIHHGYTEHKELHPREDGKTNTISTVQKDNQIAEPIRVGAMPRPNGELSGSQGFRIYSEEGKSVALKGNAGGAGGKTGLYAEPVPECFRVKEATKQGYTDIKLGGCVDMSMPNSKTRRGRNMEKKSNCLQTSCQFYQYCGNVKTPIYEVKDGMITIKGKSYPIKLVDGYYIIRKLTVRECMRLQTVPEWYEFPVSNTQAYKMLGNGWTVKVISHLLKCIGETDG